MVIDQGHIDEDDSLSASMDNHQAQNFNDSPQFDSLVNIATFGKSTLRYKNNHAHGVIINQD